MPGGYFLQEFEELEVTKRDSPKSLKNIPTERSGLWKSIFGYFRGPPQDPVAFASKIKDSSLPDQECNLDDDNNSDKMSFFKDPEIHLSLCLSAFKALEPQNLQEMERIFNEYQISSEKFQGNPFEVMKYENLVIKIGPHFFDSRVGIAMIMSFIVFKRPLSPDQIGKCLNEQFLG